MEKVQVKMIGKERFNAAKKIMAVTNKIGELAVTMSYAGVTDADALDEIYDNMVVLKRLKKKYNFDVKTALSNHFEDEIDFITDCGLDVKFDTIVNEETEETGNA